MPAAIGGRLEILADVIRREQRDAAGPAMHKGGLDRPRDIGFAGQVRNRVVHEHRVELLIQPHGPHVADVMLAPRIELPAVREHAVRQIREHQPLHPMLHVRRVVAATRSQLQHRLDRRGRSLLHRLEIERGFLRIVRRRRHQRPPVSQFVIQLRHCAVTRYTRRNLLDPLAGFQNFSVACVLLSATTASESATSR